MRNRLQVAILIPTVLALAALGLAWVFTSSAAHGVTSNGEAATFSCGDTISNSVTLTQNVVCPPGFDAAGGPVITIGAANITITGGGFTFDYSDAVNVGQGIHGGIHSDVTIQNLTFTGSATYQIYTAGNNFSLLNNTIPNGRVLLDGTSNATVVGNSITSSPGDALVLRSNTLATYTITDNDLRDAVSTSLSIERAYGGATLTLERNTFDGSKTGAILNNIKGPFTLSHTNTFVNSGHDGGIAVGLSGESVTVDGWSFSATNGGLGVYVFPFPCAGHACSRPSVGTKITNNTITGFANPIRASKQQSIELSGNVITSAPGTAAIWVDDAPPLAAYTISGNDLRIAANTSLIVSGPNSNLQGGQGIILTADGNTFDGSKVGAALDNIKGPFHAVAYQHFRQLWHWRGHRPEDRRQGRDGGRMELQRPQRRSRRVCTSLLVRGPRLLTPVGADKDKQQHHHGVHRRHPCDETAEHRAERERGHLAAGDRRDLGG